MIQINRILIPTDFSDHSANALRYGCVLAEKFSSEIYLLHVMQDLVAMIPEPGLAFPPPGDYMAELKVSADAALAKLPDPDWGVTAEIVRDTRQGPPFLEILRYARAKECDLIVMGTHGRSGLAHMLMGSVAEKVVRKAACPVLTVRPDGHEFEMP